MPDVLRWNTQPLDVDQYPERVWDWGDVQFLRGVKWGTPIDLAISGVSIDQLDRPTYTWLGTNDLRQREFDAATALIAPPAPSWIILDAHQQVGKELTSLFNNVRPITDAKTVASHRVYHLYHFDLGMRILEAARQSDQAAVWSGNLYPDQASSHPIDLPVSFGRTVKLIGFQIVTGAKSSPVSVLTYWQAGEQIALPLQLFIHAIGPRGQIIAQQDQLDAPASDWRPGDLIAQVNRLNAAFASGPVWIEVGWYHPDSGERLPIIVDGIAVDDRLLLKAIER